MIRALLREPLLQFAVLGAIIFWVNSDLRTEHKGADTNTIVVDRQSVLTYLKYRPLPFGSKAQVILDHASKSELQLIIDSYIRDEVLYREAKALQLDKWDYVARLRLIQQLEFVLRGFSEDRAIDDDAIENYYELHGEDFYIPPRITFAHVFFSTEKHESSVAQALAERELNNLNQSRMSADKASSRGERFLYYRYYVDVSADRVASDFGKEFQQRVFALETDPAKWRGPFQSTYGFHLVQLSRKDDGHRMPAESARAKIEHAIREANLDAQFEQSVRALRKRYKIEINLDYERQ